MTQGAVEQFRRHFRRVPTRFTTLRLGIFRFLLLTA